MELYLIRHGQSANNRRKDRLKKIPSTATPKPEPRIPDPELTSVGERQACLAGEWLKGEGIDTLYCGPMLRTLQTARIIGDTIDATPHVFVGLHEWAGVWKFPGKQGSAQLYGLTCEEMSAMFPGFVLPDEVTNRGWWFHDWEGDRAMLQLAHRNALSFVAYLEAHHVDTEQHVAAVLHGGSGSSLVGALFGIAQDVKRARFSHDNTGISRISITPEHRQLRYLNRIDHLRPLQDSADDCAPTHVAS